MLNISSSQPVSWPTAPPMPTAPVQAVPAVGAAPSSSGDAQTDSGRQGQKPQGASAPAVSRATPETTSGAPAAQPAPLLPRGHKDGDAMSVADRAAENRIQNEQRLEEEQKAREKEEQKVQLKEVLASVWKASAAVVDVVLGREKTDAIPGDGAAVGALPAISGVEPTAAPKPASPAIQTQVELPGIEPIPAALRRELEPTAYTEQGAGSWEPLGAGSLINQRV
ncbi:hypothetical protein [Hydrogenophaga sp. RWCD_12]|uniref:hypothetical protein n=1 Tax=Hydrogenophaga sp. RWCD_12 TaxID=3391190 RepID=UPI0039854D8F